MKADTVKQILNKQKVTEPNLKLAIPTLYARTRACKLFITFIILLQGPYTMLSKFISQCGVAVYEGCYCTTYK